MCPVPTCSSDFIPFHSPAQVLYYPSCHSGVCQICFYLRAFVLAICTVYHFCLSVLNVFPEMWLMTCHHLALSPCHLLRDILSKIATLYFYTPPWWFSVNITFSCLSFPLKCKLCMGKNLSWILLCLILRNCSPRRAMRVNETGQWHKSVRGFCIRQWVFRRGIPALEKLSGRVRISKVLKLRLMLR